MDKPFKPKKVNQKKSTKKNIEKKLENKIKKSKKIIKIKKYILFKNIKKDFKKKEFRKEGKCEHKNKQEIIDIQQHKISCIYQVSFSTHSVLYLKCRISERIKPDQCAYKEINDCGKYKEGHRFIILLPLSGQIVSKQYPGIYYQALQGNK